MVLQIFGSTFGNNEVFGGSNLGNNSRNKTEFWAAHSHSIFQAFCIMRSGPKEVGLLASRLFFKLFVLTRNFSSFSYHECWSQRGWAVG